MGRNKNFIVSEETRKKLSVANKGKKLTEEAKLLISMKNKGNKHTEETKNKISIANKGKKRSDEFKKRISILNKGKHTGKGGRKHLTEFTERINKAGYIKIYINKKYVLKHRYIWEKHNGIIPEGMVIHHIDENRTNNNIDNLQIMESGIHSTLHHKGKRCKNKKSRKIYQIDKISKVVINTYERLSDIQGFSIGCVSKCCNLKGKSHMGYIWSYSIMEK